MSDYEECVAAADGSLWWEHSPVAGWGNGLGSAADAEDF